MRGSRLLTMLIASILAVLAIAVSGGSAAPPAPKVAWSKCFVQFQCGTVQVPLDYDQPGGASISIALARLPATDPSHRIGSLFQNPGGPGGSGIDFLLENADFIPAEIRARFDVVGFDPRGIIRSNALRCFGTPKQWEPFFTPFAFPRTPEEEAIWETADRYLDAACAQRGGAIMNHMSTANVARDLDQLRQAVGDTQLNYLGVSYGTFLGVTYANLFPDKVRALVLDGVLDPIAWTTGVGDEADTLPFSYRERSDAGAQATLNEFFRLCDVGGSACAFSGGAAARFAALADELKQHPIQVTFPDGTVGTLDYSNFIAISLGAMYDSLGWEDFAQLLADIESQASAASLGARLETLWHGPSYIAKRGFPRYPNFVEGFPAVACSDSVNPHSYSAWSQAGAAADAQFGYFGRMWTWVSSVCAAWPGTDSDRYLGPFTAATANPVLVIGNQFDPATRYEGAVTVAGLLPNSRLLTLHGWGHGALGLSECTQALSMQYLLTVSLPPPGTVCEQDHVPFTSS